MSDTIIDTPSTTEPASPTVDTPAVTPEVTPGSTTDSTTTDIAPVTTDTPSTDLIDEMSEAELLAAIDSIMNPVTSTRPTEPTSFPSETPAPASTPADDVNAEIARLTKEVELSVDKDAEIELMKGELQSKQESVDLVEKTWTAFAEAIPMLAEILPNFVKAGEDGTVSYDNEVIPLHFRPDNWKRVEENTIVGPLVTALLKGEQLDIP